MAGVTPNGRNRISRALSRAGTSAAAASLRSSAHPGFGDEPGTDSGKDPGEHTEDLLRYYSAMSSALGPMRWWPARTPFEVIVGAILTQSTSWANVERAIENLHTARMLTPSAILNARTSRLAALVRPSGYFRQKAKKLKAFVRFLQREYDGSLKRMFQSGTHELREKLLSVHGIGPETADSILLYAGNHPVFVVDAYTHRIFERHAITRGKPDYETVRALFETALPRDPQLWNEFHALIVNTGKNWCRKSVPRCEECPLRSLLPATSPLARFRSGAQEISSLPEASA
jgi:endonuclease III related protein